MKIINENQADLLADFVASIRPDWDAPGVKTALGHARGRGDAVQVAIAAIRAAADPANRTPAIIARDGRHWRPAQPDDETTRTLHPPWCGLCLTPHWDHQPHQRPESMPPTDEFRQARAALRDETTYAP